MPTRSRVRPRMPYMSWMSFTEPCFALGSPSFAEALFQLRSRVRGLVLAFLLALHWSTAYSRLSGEGTIQVGIAAIDHDLLPRRVRGLRGR
jgi:hypothetical protein